MENQAFMESATASGVASVSVTGVEHLPSPVDELSASDRLTVKVLSVEDIQDWLADHIAEEINVDPEQIDFRTPFSSYGLSSSQAMNIANLGKEQLGVQISPLAIWNCPNIESLSQHLVQELSTSAIEMFEI